MYKCVKNSQFIKRRIWTLRASRQNLVGELYVKMLKGGRFMQNFINTNHDNMANPVIAIDIKNAAI
ncbi:hypothetical protein AB733_08715 [Photobacterium swingsii]|uniref:Uncharacterized protein n=1 Tax=Photobacterium swingsii TaxID=680026 RepID=A0A0J8VDA7_9GAMM|nr:hypothetical protein AB733_08715 [Photobacterium swingsii]PSW23556.1 hypothetical protein C9I94_15660 [Photobacterium swingsii]